MKGNIVFLLIGIGFIVTGIHVISINYAISQRPTYAQVDSIVEYKVDSILKSRPVVATLTNRVVDFYDDNRDYYNYARYLRDTYHYPDTCVGGE